MPSIPDFGNDLRNIFAELHVDVSNAYRVGEDIGKKEGSKLAREFVKSTRPQTIDEARRAFHKKYEQAYSDPRSAFFYFESVMLRHLPQGQFRTDAEAMIRQMTEGAMFGFERAVKDEIFGYIQYLKMFGGTMR